jgi:hypothetical protein
MVTPSSSSNVAAVAAIGSGPSKVIATVTTSISAPHRTALVLRVERCDARRRFLVRPFPEFCRERSNSLAMAPFAFLVLVGPSSVTVPG